MAALVDTNVLVYVHDPRFPEKQRRAIELLRRGIATDSVRIAHQAVVEFHAATTRARRGEPPLLSPEDARRATENLLREHVVLYPGEALVRTAIRGAATYQLSWYDAHMWAYAEHFGLHTLVSEDFAHDRIYGTVRTIDPFVPEMPEGVGEPLAPYQEKPAVRRRARRA